MDEMQKEQIEILLYAIAYIIGGLSLGIIFEYILLKKVVNFASKTKWQTDDVIFNALRGLIIFWFTAAGIYFAIKLYPNPYFPGIIDKIFISAAILSISLFAARMFTGFIQIKSTEDGNKNPATSIITNIVRITVYTIGILIILQSFGISITPILTALGVGGLAVALALQDTLSNLFSGIQVIASKQIRKGDYVKLSSGEAGYVEDISWKNTTIRMLSNNIVFVPNSKLSSSILTNYNFPDKEMAVLIPIGVSYDSDLEKVERITIQTGKKVLQNVNGGVTSFEPFIRYHSFADSSINFTVILRAKQFVDQYLLKHEFVKALIKNYRANAIEIPFPIRTVHLAPSIHSSESHEAKPKGEIQQHLSGGETAKKE